MLSSKPKKGYIVEKVFGGSDKNRAYGTALLRIVSGLILLQAGYAKVFIKGPAAVGQGFKQGGIFMGELAGPFISFLELIGGAALVLGIFTRYLGLVFALEFLVAVYAKVALWQTGWSSARIDVLLVVIMLYLASGGGGAFNLGDFLKRGH